MADYAKTLERLKQAVADSSVGAVAKRIGVSRTAVSLIVHDKYPANPKNVYEAFERAYGGVTCPHLGSELTRAQCREYANKARPSNQLGLAHWRACQNCPHKGG